MLRADNTFATSLNQPALRLVPHATSLGAIESIIERRAGNGAQAFLDRSTCLRRRCG